MLSIRGLAAIGAVLVVVGTGGAFAQETPAHSPMGPDQMHDSHGMIPMAGHLRAKATMPIMPGQEAFGAIQEIVHILETDPKTDWSKVDLEALRQHLIDMNEVTLDADEAPKAIDGGLEVAVTGSGRALSAIQRMIPAWAETMNGYRGWSTKAAPLPNGEVLTVTAVDPKEIQHIRGLGFIGMLVSGAHHQLHHLMMAKGEMHMP